MTARKILNGCVYAAGAAYIALFLFTATLRLVYPYEVEWNEGAVLDHAIRVLDGKPIYVAPSLDFSPFVYTPIYYYAVAALMKLGGIGLWSGRLISILATLATSAIVFRIVRRESGSDLLAFAGLALYIAFYRVTGFFYDIVRMDALAVFLVAASLYLALYLRRGYLYAAILTALAYFTKQQMLFILPAIAFELFLRNRKQSFIFIGISIGAIIFVTYIFNITTHGWFSYFTTSVPAVKASHGFSWQTWIEFYPTSIMGWLGIFTAIILLSIFLRGSNSKTWRLLIVSCGLALVSSSISFANPGGYQNVLMPLLLMISILFPLSVDRMARTVPEWSMIGPIIVLSGFFALIYDPQGQTMLLASARQKKAGDEFVQKLKAIPGEVWIPFHGYIGNLAGKQTHIHFMALNDALEMHDTTSARLEQELMTAERTHRFGTIILDEQRVYGWNAIPNYTRAGKIFSVPNVFLSRIGEAPTRPDVLYIPAP